MTTRDNTGREVLHEWEDGGGCRLVDDGVPEVELDRGSGWELVETPSIARWEIARLAAENAALRAEVERLRAALERIEETDHGCGTRRGSMSWLCPACIAQQALEEER